MKKPKKRDSIIANRLLEIVRSVTGEDIDEKTRRDSVVIARGIFYKIMKDLENWSFADMAAIFGQDHATARHQFVKTTNWMKQKGSADIRNMYQRCLDLHTRDVDTETELTKIELLEKISGQDAKISELNAYIAALESDNKSLKTKDTPFESVFNVIRERMPIGKSEAAIRKINTALNSI